jgi:hypothetical protein
MSQKFVEERKIESISGQASKPKQEDDYDLENAEYEELSYGSDEDNQGHQEDWGFTQRDIVIPGSLNGLRPEMEAKAKELNLTCYFQEAGCKKIILMGEGYALTEFSTYIDSLAQLLNKTLISKLALGEHIQKEIPLTGSFKHFKPLIEKASETLELVIEHDQTKLIVHGYDRRVKELMAFLFEKEHDYGQGQFIDQEINISTFHRSYLKNIEKQAHSLGLKLDFGYDMISVRGPRKPVDKLILYLMSVETEAKKILFPKYWDFKDNNPLSLIDVHAGTDEYKLVEIPFLKTMTSSTKILSIKRIQNKYLMDQFITVINKKQEERPGEKINRELLFHGTRQNPPEKIYGNFDTGFDLQYANYGMYGKGLYFAVNSSYSNGYAYATKEGTRQMFLADVFVGKSYNSGNNSVVKAPVGYDSINITSNGFYIVYHNFYSYPLYLIDYKC